ncbi:unnamed protein product [Durusdinium trenchii]|uniref:Deoxyribodipyrimidine photo-lyase n=1 Tax=Durusdinium trenchii TaxID=1381693 RepID=A0ABP0PC17_9DINO
MWFEELRIRDVRRYNLMVRRNRLPANAQQLLDSDAETPLWEDVNVVSDPDAIKRSMVHRDILEYVMKEVLEKEFGGTCSYLESIGFGPEELFKLRALLVEPDQVIRDHARARCKMAAEILEIELSPDMVLDDGAMAGASLGLPVYPAWEGKGNDLYSAEGEDDLEWRIRRLEARGLVRLVELSITDIIPQADVRNAERRRGGSAGVMFRGAWGAGSQQRTNPVPCVTDFPVPDEQNSGQRPRGFDELRGVELERAHWEKSTAQEGRRGGSVLYWMSRDQRAHDNWALLKAQELALERRASLQVCFCLVPKFLGATLRHFDFMLRGLEETSKELSRLNIGFLLLKGESVKEVPKLLRSIKQKGPVHAVVCDMSPLRVPRAWVAGVGKELKKLKVPLIQVDAHNVVPVWEASDKQETGARTLRPKLKKLYKDFLHEFPPLKRHPHGPVVKGKGLDLSAALRSLQVDREVGPVSQELFKPGALAGKKRLEDFLKHRLKSFASLRNDPTQQALSGLSPWIKFGQISAQRCALTVKKAKAPKSSVEAFLDEAIVRRELSDNFCWYNEHYDSLKGAAAWAVETLNKHRKDQREYLYSRRQLEEAKTHDELWNAAQRQMVLEGKMHGFLRMYWAKKVLEWSKDGASALATAIYLNDRYNLDGRDPNGYVGCMWSICGVHDMGWPERKVFGKIRYMNYAGCKRKFNVEAFEARYPASSGASSKRAKRA